jgi:hypothetical protein
MKALNFRVFVWNLIYFSFLRHRTKHQDPPGAQDSVSLRRLCVLSVSAVTVQARRLAQM